LPARLVTPRGGTVLDPFAGSGSEGCAAVIEGFDYIGIEKEADYVEIARRRIAYWASVPPVRSPTNVLASARAPMVTLDAYADGGASD
jgi:DNA modification methylase